MAPLDTGSVTSMLRLAEPFGRGPGPSADGYEDLGAWLKAVREHKGLSLVQLADVTRVRRIYLEAIEAGDLSVLPSRPFAVGYVRSYARSLGLDGDAAVARFKAENPEAAPKLRAPVGVGFEADRRRRIAYAAAAALVVTLALWNIAQRGLSTSAKVETVLPASALAWPAATGPKGALKLGAPTPPPVDQTTPKPYVTPGLGVPGVDKNAEADAAVLPAALPADPAAAPPATFSSRAAVYGVAGKGGLLVQARTPASLIVRTPDGRIVFARELEAGEAYRAPLGRGLTADVSDPSAFALYLNGRYTGGLSDPLTPLDKAGQAPAAPAPQAAGR